MSLLDDLTQLAQGVDVSLNQVVNSTGDLAGSVLKVKNTIDQISGHGTNSTAAQKATAANKSILNTNVISPGVQNILIVVGIVTAGIGIIYLIKGKK